MKKISQHLQDRLLLEGKEAREQGLPELGEAAEHMVIQAACVTDTGIFNYDELTKSVHQALWKAAAHVAVYHDLSRVDLQKLEPLIIEAADKFIHQIECSYDVENKLGPFEETVPGQASNH